MSNSFNHIDIVARCEVPGIHETLAHLVTFLQAKKLKVTCETSTGKALPNFDIETIEFKTLGQKSDLIIVVGGDGSLLHASESAAMHQTPILGISRGRLGFLADIRPNEIETRLEQILTGDYWTDHRFLLQTHLHHHKQSTSYGLALNDVVLSPGKTPHMLEFEIYVDEQFVCSHRADGVLVSTPTGSTAYSLSGGGPILHPKLDALIVLPMFSHSLTSRPIVIHGNSDVRIELSEHNQSPAQISCDGRDVVTIAPNSHIYIKKNAHAISLIHPNDYDYFESLRSKLHWGQKIVPPPN